MNRIIRQMLCQFIGRIVDEDYHSFTVKTDYSLTIIPRIIVNGDSGDLILITYSIKTDEESSTKTLEVTYMRVSE